MIAEPGAMRALGAYAQSLMMKRRRRKKPPKKKNLELALIILQIILVILEILKALVL